MRDSADPIADFAIHPATVVDVASTASPPDLPIAPSSDASFRDLSSGGRQSAMDLHLRRRLWWLSSVTLILCATALASIRTLGGPAVVQRVFVAGMIANAATGLWMGWMARTQRMTVKNTAIAWFILSAGICTAILYFGLFSPAGLMVAVFVVFFSGTRDERVVVVMVYLVFAVFHAAMVAVMFHGGLPELGALPFARADLGKLAVTELLIQLVLLATLIAACAIRHSMVSTVRDLEQRARALGHHELLLDDAKRAFEAALRAAGGGRFSHQIVGAYRLGRLLGEGAMGEVYDAIDTRTGAPAAVKLLRRNVMEDQGIVQRFLTEARIVTSLRSGHVARVLETGDLGSGLPYIAMERLHGRDLRNHLSDRGDVRLPLAEADDLLRQVARGIDAAHRADVVHRDLKPSNLFRTDTGTWKILDFGVSKVIGEHTADNAIVGTPNFMSPEQVEGGTVDGRTDIFALGAIVYYAITGRLAFDGETLAAIAFQVTHHVPRLPGELVPGIPPGIDEAVMTALAKDPRSRFATAEAFSEAFSRALAVHAPAPDRDGAAPHPTAMGAAGPERATGSGGEPRDAGDRAPAPPPASGASSAGPAGAGSEPLGTLLLRVDRRQRPRNAIDGYLELQGGEPQSDDELEIGG